MNIVLFIFWYVFSSWFFRTKLTKMQQNLYQFSLFFTLLIMVCSRQFADSNFLVWHFFFDYTFPDWN